MKTYSDDWDDPLPIATPQVDEPNEPNEQALTEKAKSCPSSIAAAHPAHEVSGAPKCAQGSSPVFQRSQRIVALPPFAKKNGFPALMARSSIFCAGGRGKGALPLREIECYPPYSATIDGTRLTMRDKAIWELAVAAARESGFAGEEFPISLSEMAKASGGSGNGASLIAVAERLKRLAETRITYTLRDGEAGSGWLLGSLRKDGAKLLASLDPGLVPALARDFSFPSNAPRRSLLKGELAMWLHDFLATHERFDDGFKLAQLAKLCGYAGDARKFSAFLRDAMEDLRSCAPEVAAAFEIERVKRSSSTWRLHVEPGAEKRKFDMPSEAHASRAARAREGPPQARPALPSAERARRRRGPAL